MIVTRQLIFCWLFGAIWLLCGCWVFFKQRTPEPNWPSIYYHTNVGGWHLGLLQINKGTQVRSVWEQSAFGSPIAQKLDEIKFSHVKDGPAPGYYARKTGAPHTVTAVLVAGHGFVMPVSLHCLLFGIASVIIIVPTWSVYKRQRTHTEALRQIGDWPKKTMVMAAGLPESSNSIEECEQGVAPNDRQTPQPPTNH